MNRNKTNIEKGQELEKWFANKINEYGLDFKAGRSKKSGAGTGEKSDIYTSLTICGRNIGVECKNHKVPHIREWWEQTQKLEIIGREPVLVFKLECEDMEESKAVVYASTLLELIKASKRPKDEPEIKKVGYIDNGRRTLIWAIEAAINALKKVLSELKKSKE